MKSFSLFHCMLLGYISFGSCSKNTNNPAPQTIVTAVIVPPNDPAFTATVGFFGNDWSAKNFTTPVFNLVAKPTSDINAYINVDRSRVTAKVPNNLFGNNTNMWTGQMSNQTALINYVSDLSPGILRGPGGSASDLYFWNASFNVLPVDVNATLFDGNGNAVKTDSTSYWYGRNTPYWSLSLNDYYQALTMTHTRTGLITVNYAYARYGTGKTPVQTAAHLAADWVRYDNGRTLFWEIGNECYGNWEACYKIDLNKNQDGQPETISGDLYGQQFKVFYDSMKLAASETGATIYIGAPVLDHDAAAWEAAPVQTWNQEVFTKAGSLADFFIIHDYFTAYNTNSSATEILQTAVTVPSAAMNYMKGQLSKYGLPVKPVAMTEWNIQAIGSKQNVSVIAGMHAVVTLGEFIKYQFGQASRWDLANGWNHGDDQGLFNIGDEPAAAKWNPRPAFYYLYYFQQYFGDRMLNSGVSGDSSILSYASSFSSGQAGIVVINEGLKKRTVEIDIKNFRAGVFYYYYTLNGGTDNGDFSGAVYINGVPPSGPTGGPLNYKTILPNGSKQKDGIVIALAPRSVTFIIADGG
jgi:hypothetical protein